jgi:hypothetical protein
MANKKQQQQIYYKWMHNSEADNTDGTDGGPFDTIKEAKEAAAEEVRQDSSFSRLGAETVEVQIGPSVPVRCSVEDVHAVANHLLEDVEEAVQNALGYLDHKNFESYYATGSPQSRAELLAFFSKWCPKHVEADTVRLDPTRTKTYLIAVPEPEVRADTAKLEHHDNALAAVWIDLQHRLSAAGKVALNQLRQEVQKINDSKQTQRLSPHTLRKR